MSNPKAPAAGLGSIEAVAGFDAEWEIRGTRPEDPGVGQPLSWQKRKAECGLHEEVNGYSGARDALV